MDLQPKFSTSSLESIDSNHRTIHSHEQIEPLPIRAQDTLDQEVDKIKSTQESTKSVRVPRGERRGLLAQFVVIPEYEDARTYPKSVKYLIVFFIAFAAMTGPMGTSILLPALDDVVSDLNTSASIVNLSIGFYLLALGFFPMWWSAISETYGRRTVYLISFSMFFAFSIGAAFAPSIAALIILRVFQGGCSASVQAVGAGTISDIFIQQEMGRSMGIYYLGPLLGPFTAPIIGGVVGQVWGWRATQWVLVIVSGINLITIMFFLPETLRNRDNLAVLRGLLEENSKEQKELLGSGRDVEDIDLQELNLRREATNLSNRISLLEMEQNEEQPAVDSVMPSLSRLATNKSNTNKTMISVTRNENNISMIPTATKGKLKGAKAKQTKETLYRIFIRPTHSIVLLKHPPVALIIVYSSICFAVLYFFNMTVSSGYSGSPYNFSTILVGLMYIPNSVTYIIAAIIGGRWNDKLLQNFADRHNGQLLTESRISWNVVTAIVIFPVACLIFGWTLHYGEMWVVPLIGTALFGFAAMLVIGVTTTCLVDTLPGKGATGIALNNLVRQTLAAIATFVVDPLLNAIGAGVLFSILAGIITFASISLYILKIRAPYYREHSKLHILYDKL